MEGERKSMTKAVQLGNLRGLLSVRRTDRIPNAWVRERFVGD